MKSLRIYHSHKFQYNGNNYDYIDVKDFLTYDIRIDASPVSKTKVLNIGLAFDIETTKINELYSSMYVWQFAIDDCTIIGRNYEQLKQFLDKLANCLHITKDRQCICWIHNASYEFSFIKNWLEWDINPKTGKPKIFAISNTKVLSFEYKGIKFCDSLAITNRKLEDVAKDYRIGINKLSGELNYNLNVSCETPLKICQLAYCINDVQILQKWFHKYIVGEFLRKGYKIPLTSTGIVRNDMKRRFKKLPKDYQSHWRYRIQKGYPSQEDYEIIMKYLFRGGYVHANSVYAGYVETSGMGSADLKSSYPAQLLHHKYPYRFINKPITFFEEIKDNRKWQKENGFYGCFRFTNLKARTAHTLESINKVYDKTGKVYCDNGRISRVDGTITVLLTEIDYHLYKLAYTWEKCDCLSLRVASKEELPCWLKNLILDYFEKKETLDKDTLLYMLSKYQLNAIYGMMVTSVYDTDLFYNDITAEFDEVKKEKSWKELIKNQLLLPWFGIWCTAYARMDIFTTMLKLGTYDGRYGDTDSCKYKNIIGNQYIFDDFNNRIKRINATMYVGDRDRSIFEKLGCFEYEGKSYLFESQGAKRYIHTDISKDKKTGKYGLKTIVTIAGLPKGSLQKKAQQYGKNIYDIFVDNMTLNELESNKLGCHRENQPFTITSVDYLGHEYTVTERSCATLTPIPFAMTITPEYLAYRLKERNKYIVGERTT